MTFSGEAAELHRLKAAPVSKGKAVPGPPVPAEPKPDRSPAGLRALAERIEDKASTGFCVPGSNVGIYAEAMRALAREREQK